MNEKKHPQNCERGQAIAEMCISLVGIMAIFLGMIFVGGLAISNVQTFLDARSRAEHSAHENDSLGGQGEDIYTWQFGTQSGDSFAQGLPYTASDIKINVSSSNSSSLALSCSESIPAGDADSLYSGQFSSGDYSESSTGDSGYEFMAVTEFSETAVTGNFTLNLPELFVGAADLVSSSSNLSTEVYSIDSRHFSSDDRRSLRETFSFLFGLDADSLDLRQLPSNTVYMPRMVHTE